ncbi:MAG: hypothetical protein JWQ50_5034 [Caballeronia mineralivorans]|jgi:hypothetical protein|nr:hypothetical protein [Caballeronia mineralivorans]
MDGEIVAPHPADPLGRLLAKRRRGARVVTIRVRACRASRMRIAPQHDHQSKLDHVGARHIHILRDAGRCV